MRDHRPKKDARDVNTTCLMDCIAVHCYNLIRQQVSNVPVGLLLAMLKVFSNVFKWYMLLYNMCIAFSFQLIQI